MTLASAQLVAFAGATDLRVTRVADVVPAPYTLLGWSVPDIASAIGELSARGVEFRRYEGMTQDELGVGSAPSGTRVAWFRDPDGNTLAISQAP